MNGQKRNYKKCGENLNFDNMKKILILSLFLFLLSCEEKKIEFIESKTMNLFLLKNLPRQDSLVKKELKLFLIKNPQLYKNSTNLSFFEYTWNTSYFLYNRENGGVGANTIDMYQDKGIAEFFINKCVNDSTKLVGKLRYYNKYGNYYQPDTIIGKCK